MNEELQLALMDIVSPEQLWRLLDAHRVLASVGLTDFEDELQQVIGMQDGVSDNYLFVSRIQDVLIYACGDALRQYGVTVIADTDLSIMTGILEATANIEHYILPEVLHDLTGGEWTAEEALAQIVPLFSALSAVEAFDHLEHVKVDTITRIREIAENNMRYAPVEVNRPEDHRKKITSINRLLQKTDQRHPHIVATLAKSGVRSGESLMSLMAWAIEDLDRLNTEDTGMELLGLVLFSDLPYADTPDALAALIKDYTDDYHEQVRIQHSANEWFGAVEV